MIYLIGCDYIGLKHVINNPLGELVGSREEELQFRYGLALLDFQGSGTLDERGR